MTAKELQEQIDSLLGQIYSLQKQLINLEGQGTWDKIKRCINRTLNLFKNLISWFWLPGLIFIFIVLIYIFSYITWKEFIELMRVLIWPVTILTALFFFRKIFTYLFLSMREFNFFGLKGEFNDVQKVINEKARELRDKERAEEEQKKKLEFYEKEQNKNKKLIEALLQEKGASSKRWYDLAQGIQNDYKALVKEYTELDTKYKEKLKQEEETRIKKEAIRRLIEDRNKRRHETPF